MNIKSRNIKKMIKNIFKITKQKYIFLFICLMFLSTILVIPVFASVSINTISSVTPYAVLDEEGSATLNNSISQLVITSSTQEGNVVIENGTTNPTINLNPFCSDGSALFPALNIVSINAYSTSLTIPAATTAVSNSSDWDCVISTPTITTIALPETSGAVTTLSKAIKIGFGDNKLSFDKPVRIVFINDKGKKIGYTQNGSSFSEILSLCNGDTGAGLETDEECKVDIGNDLVVWTRHFTKFATFSTTAILSLPLTTSPTSSPTITSVPAASAGLVTPAPVTVPQATHKTTISNLGVKLFDIILNIDKAILNKSSDLVARTQFSSFGTVPTSVSMIYRIEDIDGREIYTESDEVMVETERLVTKNFTNLNTGTGKYTLILTTVYGDSVKDEFKQAFEVRTSVLKLGIKTWIWIVSSLVIVGMVGLIIFLSIKKRKKKEKRYE